MTQQQDEGLERAPGTAGRSQQKKAGTSKKMLIFWVLAALPLALVLWPTCMVVGVSLIPTLVMYLFEREPGKQVTICVGLANAVGALPAVAGLWDHGQSYEAAVNLLRDGLTWLVPYAAAAGGYMVYFATESIITAYYRITTAERIRQVQSRQRKLIEEWGPDVVLPEYAEFRPPDEEDEGEESIGDAETVAR